MNPNTPLSDDELGAMLGHSVHAKVDDVPTITPAFDGVERRARQITNRRRAAGGLAVGALALFGGLGAAAMLSDDEGATENNVVTEPSPPVDDAVAETDGSVAEAPLDGAQVTGLVDNTRFMTIDSAGTEIELLAVDGDERITNAMLLADGSILAVITDSLDNPNRRVVHLPTVGAVPTVLSDHGHLAGGAVIDGTPYAFVGDLVEVADDFSFEPTALRLVDLRTGDSVDLIEDAFGIEWAVTSVDVRGDQLLVESFNEAGWSWDLHALDPAVAPTPISSGSWEDDLQRLSPRFDRSGAAPFWWIEHDPTNGGHWLVNGGDPRVEAETIRRIPLEVTGVRLDLEVTDDQMVINLLDPVTGLGSVEGDVTTIWVDPQTLVPSLEAEDGVVRFVEPAELSAAEARPVPEVAPSDAPIDLAWEDPASFGIVDIESDTNIGDFGPLPGSMVGFDGNGTVWVASPVGDGETSQADLWQVEGIEDVRYVEDPTIDGDQNFLFQVGDRVIHVNEEKQARLIAENATLVGADMRLGRPTAYIAFHPSDADDPRTGDVQPVDLRTGEAGLLFEAIAGNDAVVRNVVHGGEVILIDMTGPAGSNVLADVADPTATPAGLADADAATLSTDGSTLFWLDQVGVDGLAPQMELGVAAVATGDTRTIGFALPDSEVALDYDLSPLGDQLLLIRSWSSGVENGRQTSSYVAPLLLDPATGATTELGLESGFWKPVAN